MLCLGFPGLNANGVYSVHTTTSTCVSDTYKYLVSTDTLTLLLLLLWFQRCATRSIEHDAPISRYYERLAAVQARGSQASHQVLRDILKEVSVYAPAAEGGRGVRAVQARGSQASHQVLRDILKEVSVYFHTLCIQVPPDEYLLGV